MKKRNKIVVLSLVLVVSVVMVLGGRTTYANFREAFFSEPGAEADTVHIGVLEPQTGNDSAYGEVEIRGIQIAHQLRHNVMGQNVELLYADTQSSIYVTETAVSNLIDKKPAVVLGSYGNAVSLVASRSLEEAQIPAITITATNPLITANNDYYFRVAFTDARQGTVLADFVWKYLQMSRAAVVRVEGEDSYNEMVSRFTERLTRNTDDENAISDVIWVKKNAKNYETYVEELRASGARAVFLPTSLSVAERMLDEAERQGLSDMTFIGPDSWQGEEVMQLQVEHPTVQIAVASNVPFTTELPENPGTSGAQGAGALPEVYNGPMQPAEPGESVGDGESGKSTNDEKSGESDQFTDAEKTGESDESTETSDPGQSAKAGVGNLYQQFVTAYQKAYGPEEQPPEAAALGFDAYMIALQAIEKAGTVDGNAVKDALLATSGYLGASGEITFDESGEPKTSVCVNLIRDDALVTVFYES